MTHLLCSQIFKRRFHGRQYRRNLRSRQGMWKRQRVSCIMYLDVCRVLTDLANNQTMMTPSHCGLINWYLRRICLGRMRSLDNSGRERISKLLTRENERRISRKRQREVEVPQHHHLKYGVKDENED